MAKARTELEPAEWQITATTIHCDFVDDFVTIMVNKDWSTRCAWYGRHKQKALEDKKQKFAKEIKLKIEKCAARSVPMLRTTGTSSLRRSLAANRGGL